VVHHRPPGGVDVKGRAHADPMRHRGPDRAEAVTVGLVLGSLLLAVLVFGVGVAVT
jgi:hypothetical protein